MKLRLCAWVLRGHVRRCGAEWMVGIQEGKEGKPHRARRAGPHERGPVRDARDLEVLRPRSIEDDEDDTV